MGYQNFSVQVTSFERRVERSCGIQSNYAVRPFPCVLIAPGVVACSSRVLRVYSPVSSGLRHEGSLQHCALLGGGEAV